MSNTFSYSVEFDVTDNIYIARCVEISSLSAHGKTQEEALKEIKAVVLETLKWIGEDNIKELL